MRRARPPAARATEARGTALRGVAVIACAAAAASCGAAGDVALACPDLTLAASAAQPLDTVAVTGLPTELGDTLAAVVVADSLTAVAPVVRTESGARLVAPAHPSASLEGGPVQLRITDGVASCPASPFTVRPLPPAPGVTAKAVAALDTLLDAEIRSWGLSAGALRTADPDTLIPPLVLVRMAQQLVDAPDNPDALARIEGEAAAAEPGTSDALIEAMLAKAGLPALVAERAAALDTVMPLRRPITASEPVAGAAPRGRSARGEARATFAGYEPGRAVVPPDYLPDWYTKPDAEALHFMMDKSMRGEVATTGEAAEIFALLQATLGLGAMIPSSYGKLFAVYGAYVTTMYLIDELSSKLLPRRLTLMEITASPTAFEEDHPGPGRLERIEVYAASEGLVLDATIAEDIIGRLTRMPPRLRDQLSDFQRAVIGQITGEINSAVAESATQGSAVADLSPRTFGPTDITAAEWRDVNFIGPAIEPLAAADNGQVPYVPREVGTTTLRIATKWELFGFADGQHIVGEVTLRVDPIVVEMDPDRAFVEPNDTVRITARASNALVSSFEWTATGGAEQVDWKSTGLASGWARFRMPDPLPDEIVVTARSLADRSHLRSRPERVGHAILRPRELVIVPTRDCVETGSEVDFDVAGMPDDEVRWSASGGAIDDGGVFRPGGSGSATIRVASRDDRSLRAEREVRVEAECPASCTFTASVNGSYHYDDPSGGVDPLVRSVNEAYAGDGSGIGPGPTAGASFYHRRDTVRRLTLEKEYERPDGRRHGVLFGLTIELPPIPFGETGSWEAEGATSFGTRDWRWGASTAEDHLTNDDGRLTVWITRNDRQAVQGRFEGRMWSQDLTNLATGDVTNAWFTVRGEFDAGDYISGCGLIDPEEQQRKMLEDVMGPDAPDPDKLDELLKESGR